MPGCLARVSGRGNSPGSYPNTVTRNNPGLSTYLVGNLVSDTYYFVMTAFNTNGAESVQSNPASKTIPWSLTDPPGLSQCRREPLEWPDHSASRTTPSRARSIICSPCSRNTGFSIH